MTKGAIFLTHRLCPRDLSELQCVLDTGIQKLFQMILMCSLGSEPLRNVDCASLGTTRASERSRETWSQKHWCGRQALDPRPDLPLVCFVIWGQSGPLSLRLLI